MKTHPVFYPPWLLLFVLDSDLIFLILHLSLYTSINFFCCSIIVWFNHNEIIIC